MNAERIQAERLAESIRKLSPERRAEVAAIIRADRFDRFAAGARASVRRYMAGQVRRPLS